tara:strand:- start:3087 stop:4139 length:1053 start_codon:yes stop_codon:yes gene_type:complete
MSTHHGELLLITINHETVSLEKRERYSLDDVQIKMLYETLHRSPMLEESLILNTCNRFELYSKTSDPKNGGAIAFKTLASFYNVQREEIESHARIRFGREVIKHLIEVSAGLRSQITGEAEIFGQVKKAYATCQRLGYSGRLINRMVQKGFQAAKLIRHSTQIGEGQINISNVAVDLSLKIFGSLKNTSALVVGTGEIGEKTVKALKSRGASNFGVASHHSGRADEIAEKWGGIPHALGELETYLNDYDIIISSSETDSSLLDARSLGKHMNARKNRPLFLIDLGLPRNMDASCQEIENVYLYNLDDLAKIATDNLSERRAAIKQSEKIAAQKSASIWQMLESRGLVNFQ